ncbi:Truncated FRIGIDA-like protein 1 [Linum perenne]
MLRMTGSSESWGIRDCNRQAASMEMKFGKSEIGGSVRGEQQGGSCIEKESMSDEVVEICPVSREVYDLDDETESEMNIVKVMGCPDLEFYDFEKDRSNDFLEVDQIWAMYDDADAMPRNYGQVKEVFKSKSKLLITWLDASPVTEDEQDWYDQDLPISCGMFETGEDGVVERMALSHRMDIRNGKDRNIRVIYPKKGETWAIFKDWDIKWCCEPEKHKPPYSYDLVEILSDFTEQVGVKVAVLSKVEGFVSIFRRGGCDIDISFCVRPTQMLSFSHRVPSSRMTGEEREGVPVGSFELDTAALPSSVFNIERIVDARVEEVHSSKEAERSHSNSANCTPQEQCSSFQAKEKTSSPRECGSTEFRDLRKRNDNLNSSKFVDNDSVHKLKAPSTGENRSQTGGQTFWTCCPSCKVKFKYYSRYLDPTMRCEQCQQTFVAHDVGPVFQQGSDVRELKKGSDDLNSSRFVGDESADKLMVSPSTGEDRSQTSNPLCHSDKKTNLLTKVHSTGENRSHTTQTAMPLKRNLINEEGHSSKKPRSEDELNMGQRCMIGRDKDGISADYVRVSEKELDFKQAELAMLEERIKTCKMELERTQVSLQERREELLAKEGFLRSIESKIKEANSKIEDSKHDDRVTTKEDDAELVTLKECIKECKKELERTQASLQERRRKHLVKDCSLQSIEDSIKEANARLEDRKNQYNAMKRSINECTVDLRSKQSQLKALERSIQESMVKEKALSYVKVEVRECCQALETKEKQLDDVKKSVEATELVLDAKVKQLNEVKAKLVHNSEKLKAMDEHRNRMKIAISELKRKRDYYQSVQRPSQEQSAATFVNDRNKKVSLAVVALNLQLELNRHFRNHDHLQREVFTLIKSSADPAKLVLEAMNGFYPKFAEHRANEYAMSFVRRTCINLLEHLLKLRPPITNDVREEAMKLAMEWKAELMSEPTTSLEVLGFLQLVSAFGIAPDFNNDEVKKLLVSNLPRQGNGIETWRSLGIIMDDLTEGKPGGA